MAVGENVDKDPVRVAHNLLRRVSGESPFRSWCPVCDEGILLISRTKTFTLSRVDRCTMCGQLFVYGDDTIGGVELEPSLEALFGSAPTEGFSQGCKLCGNELPNPYVIYCGAACCARWEAGERPKWPTVWERLLRGLESG